jgi:hypothetical protein
MKAHRTDTIPLEAIPARWFREYLIDHGWRQIPFKREGLLVFEGPMDDDGEPIVQVIPRSERSSDFGLRATQLVDALSIIEDRPAEEILRDIRARDPSLEHESRLDLNGPMSQVRGRARDRE